MARLPVALLSVLTGGVALLGAQQEATFRGAAHAVSVYATVVDDSGRLVPHLTKDDFEVFDNGKRQNVTVFSNERQPITIVVMLDRSGSMSGHFELVRDAAAEFVLQLLPADRARIGSFSDLIQIDPAAFTSDRNELLRILREDLQPPGPTPLWNATGAAMNALAQQDGRRVVLVFTDGKDSPSRPEVSTTFREIRERVQLEETMVYAIGLATTCEPAPESLQPPPGAPLFQGRGGPGRGSPQPRQPGTGGRIRIGPPAGRIGGLPRPGWPGGGIGGLGGGRVGSPGDVIGGPRTGVRRTDPVWGGCTASKPDPNLRELAADGGGGYFELKNTDDLRATFARVADELHHQYLLAFTPASLDGRAHSLEVRVRASQMSVRARKSYMASVTK